MEIKNISEAKEAVAALNDFLGRFEKTLGALGDLTGVSVKKISNPTPQSNGVDRIRHTTERAHVSGVPDSMRERVVQILTDSDRPLGPKELVAKYEALGWPAAPNGKLYSTLLAAAYYLKKRGKLKSESGKYFVSGTLTEFGPTR